MNFRSLGSILITGGTGSFGQAFTRRLLHDHLAERICIYSRSEWRQAQMRAELYDDPRLRFFIGCVRDLPRLQRACEGITHVVHAAALKRIDACAYNVQECVQTNVLGSANVVNACLDSGVRKAVALCSDKAVNATTTYGMTKALAERIFLEANAYAGQSGTYFASCLYGNIAGSTGSVIPIWRKILATSDTVPISDPDATRFWMTQHEAVELVLRALREMHRADQFIPTLPAYRLGDLAVAMGAKQFRITGATAPHEKKHEEMRPGDSSETARRMSIEELREALKNV